MTLKGDLCPKGHARETSNLPERAGTMASPLPDIQIFERSNHSDAKQQLSQLLMILLRPKMRTFLSRQYSSMPMAGASHV